jgi:5-methylcytosine-specific restriction endonuclease McrA
MKQIALIIALLAAMLTPAFGRGYSGFSGRHSYRAYRTKSYGTRSYASRAYARSRTHRTRTYHRSRAARAEFQRQHPCPSTGRTSGACPDYVVDHVKPLACGGADASSNMQWETVAGGKAKDKWEAIGCK